MVNVEADSLLGPMLPKKAEQVGRVYSMAYGDQPALIAEQIDWARAVGLEVVCAGKGTRYQPEYHYSTPQTVWGHYGFSEERVTSGDYIAKMFNSFLDRTKSAIEMCAVANGEGGYTVYGRIVRARESLEKGFLLIGLANHVKLVRPVPKDVVVTYADVKTLLKFRAPTTTTFWREASTITSPPSCNSRLRVYLSENI